METTAQLLETGLQVTFIGMTVVFILLTTLVGVVMAMSALCRRFAPETPPVSRAVEDDEQLVSAIAAAINHYRRSRAS